MPKNKFKVVENVDDDADLHQASLLPRPKDTTGLSEIHFKIKDLIYEKSTFNLQTGSRVFAVRARRFYGCFYGWPQTYTLQNPTWDGKSLGLTIYDVENHRHVFLVFAVHLDMTPEIDGLFSSTPAL